MTGRGFPAIIAYGRRKLLGDWRQNYSMRAWGLSIGKNKKPVENFFEERRFFLLSCLPDGVIRVTSRGERFLTLDRGNQAPKERFNTMAKAASTVEKNYSEAQEIRLQAVADANGGKIDNAKALELAEEFGKDVRSIRAKAVRMGIYKAKEKTNKAGGKVEGKEEIAKEISDLVGRNMESLAKAAKEDIRFLRDVLAKRAA